MSSYAHERRERVRAMRAKGMTIREIAALLGVSPARVSQIAASQLAETIDANALARFPDLKPSVARRLAERFPDDAAVCTASDRALLSVRNVGLVQLARLRARYPFMDEELARLVRSIPAVAEDGAPALRRRRYPEFVAYGTASGGALDLPGWLGYPPIAPTMEPAL